MIFFEALFIMLPFTLVVVGGIVLMNCGMDSDFNDLFNNERSKYVKGWLGVSVGISLLISSAVWFFEVYVPFIQAVF